MTTLISDQLDRLRQTPWRARIGWVITAVALGLLVWSLGSLVSVGVFFGVGVAPLFLLGAWLSPSPVRRRLAVLGSCWSTFCLIILVVAYIA